MKTGVLRKILLTALALVVLTGAGAGWYLANTLPQTAGEIAAPVVGQSVRIARTDRGVPNIFAENERDAYFALGLVHAQDRLWQMEAFRRAGQGRLSEFAGSATLGVDRFMRVIGLSRGLGESFAALPEAVRKSIEAYVAGINHGVATLKALPPEFALLGVEPDPWTEEDVILVARLLSVRLSANLRSEKLFSAMAIRLGPGRMGSLLERWPADQERVLLDLAARRTASTPVGELKSPWLPMTETASNAWVVGGARSATGAPLLANDPHLGLEAPILWYLARLVIGDRDLAGATIPGLPFHILGQNGHIAWGATAVGADIQDLFIERLDSADEQKYETPDGSRAFSARTETIAVKGGDAVEITVRESRHGPVLSDFDQAIASRLKAGHVAALAFTTTRGEDTSLATAYGLAHARSWPEAREALRAMVSPSLNFFVADRAGAIANKVTGRIPARKSGTGVLPVPGWTGAYDWQGWVPFDDLPERVAGADGVLGNANNKVAGADAAPLIAHFWHPDLRYRRVKAMLDAREKHDAASFTAMQVDTRAIDADLLLPLLEGVAPADERSRKALEMLKSWDRRMAAGSGAALIFTAWQRELKKALFEDDLGTLFPAFWRYRAPLLARHLEPGSRWCDNAKTNDVIETCGDLKTQSLKDALVWISGQLGEDMSAWTWGALHRATLSHKVLSRVPLVGGLSDLSVPTDGGYYTLNRGAGPIGQGAFRHNHGAGYRAIYDLGDPAKSRFVITTGQSGNPLSGRWGDFVSLWRNGETVPMTGTLDSLETAGADVLTLKPE